MCRRLSLQLDCTGTTRPSNGILSAQVLLGTGIARSGTHLAQAIFGTSVSRETSPKFACGVGQACHGTASAKVQIVFPLRHPEVPATPLQSDVPLALFPHGERASVYSSSLPTSAPTQLVSPGLMCKPTPAVSPQCLLLAPASLRLARLATCFTVTPTEAGVPGGIAGDGAIRKGFGRGHTSPLSPRW